MFRISFVAIVFVSFACATEGPPESGSDEEKGFTECSGVTCQPGQFCYAPGDCQVGCTSDVNCAEGQDCADEGSGFSGEGVCRDGGEGEGEGEGETNAAQACADACDFFQSCGLDAGDTAQCHNDCPDLSENQQRAVAGCAEGSCSDARACLDVDCFNDDDCGVDEQCVGNSCL
jgi:hypothetical protein